MDVDSFGEYCLGERVLFAEGVVDRSDRAVRDADRAVDTAVLAFMSISTTERASFLSDERALTAWFVGVLSGQATSDADRLETAAAGMHADLAKAIGSLLAEVEKRGRDGVDAVRDHAAGVIGDMSTAMTQAITDIRNMLRTAAARFSTDIDGLYRKVDTQGRENLAEYVAALDAAKPGTKPVPGPETRWPDDDGPYRDRGNGGPISVAEAVRFIESVDPADDVGFVAAELAYTEAMAWEATRFRGFAAELFTGGKTEKIEAERDRLAAATERLHRAMLNARQARIEVLRDERVELRRVREARREGLAAVRVGEVWHGEGEPGLLWGGWPGVWSDVDSSVEIKFYDAAAVGVAAQITGLEASVLETRTMLDDLGWWERNGQTVHGALDTAGMVPVIGIAADAVNTAIYLLEHDPANAALSAIGFVPVFGDGGSVIAKWGPDVGAAMAAAGKGAKRADNIAEAISSAPIWTSTDPLGGDVANLLETALPGRISGVNTKIPMSNGLAREVDIEVGDIVVQVKSGNARGLTGQIEQTASTTGRRVVGYAPGMPQAAWENAARQGIPIARSLDELIAIIRELG